MQYHRPYAAILARRLIEPRRFIQVVAGARQVGKTTMVRQISTDPGMEFRMASADQPTLGDLTWIEQQWEAGRILERTSEAVPVLVLDEIQKIPNWSEIVKRLWDEDTRSGSSLRVVILGSAPLLMLRGLSESLAGRFETIHLPHWTFGEMSDAFGLTLEQYVFFGGYPGAAPLIDDPDRWARYIVDSLIETTISRDVLLLSRIDKPALLRRLFHLGVSYSGQVLSYNKMVGQLQEAGNTTTLAHYLDLLGAAGMLVGLEKYAGDGARRRSSSPKLQVLNNALATAPSGRGFSEFRQEPAHWGRLVESAVGAHLANLAAAGEIELFYWRDRGREVDFVVRKGATVTALEVKSGKKRALSTGLNAFAEAFGPCRKLMVGGQGIPLEDFLRMEVADWAR